MTNLIYKELFNTAPAALVVTNAGGLIQLANRQAQLLLEIQPEQLEGRSFAGLFLQTSDATSSSFTEFLEYVVNTKRHTLRKKNGAAIYVELNYILNMTESGNLYTWSIYSIEENKRLDYALKERVKEQLSILNVTELLFRQPDPDKAFTDCLAAIRSGWQFPESAAVRICLADGKVYATDTFRETEWMLVSPIEGLQGTLGLLEVCYLCPVASAADSVFLYEETRLITILSKLLGLFIEQWQAIRQVKESEELIRKITSQVPGNTYQFEIGKNGELNILFVNKGSEDFNLLGDLEAVKKDSRKVLEAIHEEDLARFNKALMEAARSQCYLSVQFRLSVNGIVRWRWLRAVPDQTSKGKTIWYGATQDITPLVDYIDSIEQILFDISHVIRRPVSSLLGFTKLISETELSEKEIRDISGKLHLVVDEMDRFIRELNSAYTEKKKKNEFFQLGFSRKVDSRDSLFS